MCSFLVSLCCKFLQQNIKYKTFNRKKIINKDIENIKIVYENNINALQKSFNYCADNGIQGFRVTSELLPYINVVIKEKILDKSYLATIFEKIKKLDTKNLILSMHPSQIVNFTSSDDRVINIGYDVLNEHFLIADLLNINEVNIHVGGTYGDKQKHKQNFINNIKKLFTSSYLSRITIENDEFSYCIEDLFDICNCVKELRPVFDIHHHHCYSLKHKLKNITEYAEKIKYYWSKYCYLRIHISSPITQEYTTGFKSRPHHDYILKNECFDCLNFFKKIGDKKVLIDIEAKAKELAIKKFLKDIASLN